MDIPSTDIGKFEAFEEFSVQAVAEITYSFKPKKLQMLIIDALKELNNQTEIVNSDMVTSVSPVTCKYEVGIAEGVYFNFLTEKERERLEEYMKKKTFTYLDFIVYIFFKHRRDDGKDVSLWSDSNYIRFDMTQKFLKILIHQFKGTRKLPLDILIEKIVDKINDKTKTLGLRAIKINIIRGH